MDFKKILNTRGMTLVSCTQQQKETLRGLLTLYSGGLGEQFTLSMYKEDDGDKFYIPRAFAWYSCPDRKKFPLPKVKAKFTKKWECGFNLRDDQVPPVDQFLKALRTYSVLGGIMKAPTGSGKTVMAIAIAHALGMKTLVIVPTGRLMQQWVHGTEGTGGFLRLTTLKDTDVGYIRRDSCIKGTEQVAMGMLHSLAQRKYPEWVYDYFDLVIWDEVQTLGAETFSRTASLFNSRYRMGLSATPRRKDNMDKVFNYHIGHIVAEHTIQVVRPQVVTIKYTGADAAGVYFKNGSKVPLSIGRHFNLLAKSVKRTELLTRVVKMLYYKQRDTLVLSDRISILENIKKALTTLYNVPSKDIGMFISDKQQLGRKILLGTYGTAGLGADIQRLSALVFATPRADIEQPAGRLRDQNAHHRDPIIVDVIDTESGKLRGWALKRQKFYKKKGWKITQR